MKENEGQEYKLSVAISQSSQLSNLDFRIIDLVFLGNPICRIVQDNPLFDLFSLEKALEPFQNYLDKIVVSLPVCPLNHEISYLEKIASFLSGSGIHGVEVQSPGMALRIGNTYPQLKIYFGSFANIYTDQCAAIMYQLGASGGMLPYELNIDEIEYIFKSTSMEIILPVFGNFPISFSQYCYFHPDQLSYPFQCQHHCTNEVIVDYGDGRKVLHKGRAIFSLKTLNMFDHLNILMEKGFSSFRIDSLLMKADDINQIVRIFIERITQLKSCIKKGPSEKTNVAEGDKQIPLSLEKMPPQNKSGELLHRFAPHGFCNGFYFTQRGMDYVESFIDFNGRMIGHI